eukprot:4655297-Amphidinium_carterae.1
MRAFNSGVLHSPESPVAPPKSTTLVLPTSVVVCPNLHMGRSKRARETSCAHDKAHLGCGTSPLCCSSRSREYDTLSLLHGITSELGWGPPETTLRHSLTMFALLLFHS